jgi:hypothetical protein
LNSSRPAAQQRCTPGLKAFGCLSTSDHHPALICTPLWHRTHTPSQATAPVEAVCPHNQVPGLSAVSLPSPAHRAPASPKAAHCVRHVQAGYHGFRSRRPLSGCPRPSGDTPPSLPRWSTVTALGGALQGHGDALRIREEKRLALPVLRQHARWAVAVLTCRRNKSPHNSVASFRVVPPTPPQCAGHPPWEQRSLALALSLAPVPERIPDRLHGRRTKGLGWVG